MIGEVIMSFVIFAGCVYFGLMIGEKRSNDLNGNITSDDSEKVVRINDSIVMAYGGYTGVIDVVVQDIINYNKPNDLTYNQCVDNLTNNSNRIQKSYVDVSKQMKINTCIGIMGKMNGHIHFFLVSFVNGNISFFEREYTTEDDTQICFLASGINNNLGKLFMSEFYKMPVYTPKNIQDVFQRIVNAECKNDFSINNRIKCEVIQGDEDV